MWKEMNVQQSLFSVVGFLLPLCFVLFPKVHFLSLADGKSDDSEYPSPFRTKVNFYFSEWLILNPFFSILFYYRGRTPNKGREKEKKRVQKEEKLPKARAQN